MSRPSWRWTLRSGVVGALVAVGLHIALGYAANLPTLDVYYRVLQLTRALYPSSIVLLATAGREYTIGGLQILALSIGANVLLYGLIGTLVSVFRQSRGHEAASAVEQ